MKIGIGIFAHNEAARIGATLASLREQDLFRPEVLAAHEIQIDVLANGCSDGTEAAAEQTLRKEFAGLSHVIATARSLAQPGKSRTWNVYVHQISNPAAEVLILMDGDILLVGATTLVNMLEALAEYPEAAASVDIILKDIALKSNLTARERLSVSASELTRGGPPKLAGSLYAARGSVLRTIWMPPGLLVEDGFLKAMLCPDNFTRPDTPERLVRADNAAHVFEAVTDFRTLFRHEVRILTGSAMNFALFEHLRAQVQATGQDAGTLVGQWNHADSEWLPALMQRTLAEKGWWKAPTQFIGLPLRQLRNFTPLQAARRMPTALARALFNLAAAWAANRELRRGVFRW
jgi:hypothetical protein